MPASVAGSFSRSRRVAPTAQEQATRVGARRISCHCNEGDGRNCDMMVRVVSVWRCGMQILRDLSPAASSSHPHDEPGAGRRRHHLVQLARARLSAAGRTETRTDACTADRRPTDPDTCRTGTHAASTITSHTLSHSSLLPACWRPSNDEVSLEGLDMSYRPIVSFHIGCGALRCVALRFGSNAMHRNRCEEP